MKSNLLKSANKLNYTFLRYISVSSSANNKDHYKLVIVGAGTGGLSTASKFARKFGDGNVAVIDSQKTHCK